MSEKPRIVIRTKEQHASKNGKFSFSNESMRLPVDSEMICRYREGAWDQYQALPFPGKKDEAWRRTDISDIHKQEFELARAAENANGNKSEINDIPEKIDIQLSGYIIQTDDYTVSQFNENVKSDGVVFCDLLTAEKQHHDILEKVMGQVVKPDEDKFTALTASLSQYGALLYVPSGINIADAFYYQIHGTAEQRAYLSHILIYLEDGASATIYLEETSKPDSIDHSFASGIMEVIVGDNANLTIIKLQDWHENIWNISHERVIVGRDAHVDWVIGALGSRLTKSFIDLDLIGKGGTAKMTGLYITNKNQHFDYDTQQNHKAPHTSSDLMYKGALLDESRAVWQGLIYVSPTAMKTDGYQINRNLLISPKARVDTIPGLEILANDVRCTHGATVGKLDKEQLFYLLSRGIPLGEAEKLLVDGFFEPVLQQIKQDKIHAHIQNLIHNKLGYSSDN